MTEQKHNPEPWRIQETQVGYALVWPNGVFVDYFDHTDAEHIVTCINTLAGIPLMGR